MTRHVRLIGLTPLVLAACSGLLSPTAPAPTRSAESSPVPSAGRTEAPTATPDTVGWTLVAFGDSVATTGNDTGDSYPLLLADRIRGQFGVEVTVRTVFADTTAEALEALAPGGKLARFIPDADIVTVTVGANETDFEGSFPPGTCQPGASQSKCLDRANPHFAANFEAVLAAIDAIRAGKPVVLLVTSPDYNPFIGWSGAPSPTFGVDFYRQLAAQEAAVACGAAERHGGRCLDLTLLFNGADASDDAAAFLDTDHLHPSLAGRTAIADGLLALGLAPLR